MSPFARLEMANFSPNAFSTSFPAFPFNTDHCLMQHAFLFIYFACYPTRPYSMRERIFVCFVPCISPATRTVINKYLLNEWMVRSSWDSVLFVVSTDSCSQWFVSVWLQIFDCGPSLSKAFSSLWKPHHHILSQWFCIYFCQVRQVGVPDKI